MEENKTENIKKYSYEELNDIANQLSVQVRHLQKNLYDSNLANMFKRLDYLFKIIENENKFEKDFVDNCIAEIVEIITIKEDTEDTENTEN